MWYKHEATILSSYEFPLDMLRYDQCWPDSGESVAELTRSLNGTPNTRVKIAALSQNQTHWEVERWRSFLCEVTEESIRKI